MAKARGLVEILFDTCKGCELCVNACPFNVLQLSDQVNAKGYHPSMMVNPESCTGCASCAMVCPDSVITVYRVK
ncbi:MAG: 4Fe-4S binding protein [Bacteroidales bacterium]|nr:4Fe-4S binding protein [Bacteroidales bacterium]